MKRKQIHRGVFVAGTDTGVGKTIVTASLVAALRSRGLDAVPMKPVQTGCKASPGGLLPPDLRIALKAAGLPLSHPHQDLMCPFRYEPAVSPHLAARLADEPVNVAAVVAALHRLGRLHEAVVVEGAGGLLSPLGDGAAMIDLAKTMRLPLVLVGRSGLGTINHTLLSAEALHSRGIALAGVILSRKRTGEPSAVERDNVETLRKELDGCPVLLMNRLTRRTGADFALAGRLLLRALPGLRAVLGLA